MSMEEIISTHERSDKELRIAVATMERKDTIMKIKKEIIQNQERCPHFDVNFNWTVVDEHCPYCGKKIIEEENGRGF